MEDKLIRQQFRIDELEYSGSDLQQLSIELLTQKDQQQKRIEELQRNSKRQHLHMRDLKANNDKQQQRVDTLQENSNKQQQQIEELEDSVNCPICFANRRRVIFRCGHGICQDCAPRIDRCPICRGQIRDRILIFWCISYQDWDYCGQITHWGESQVICSVTMYAILSW